MVSISIEFQLDVFWRRKRKKKLLHTRIQCKWTNKIDYSWIVKRLEWFKENFFPFELSQSKFNFVSNAIECKIDLDQLFSYKKWMRVSCIFHLRSLTLFTLFPSLFLIFNTDEKRVKKVLCFCFASKWGKRGKRHREKGKSFYRVRPFFERARRRKKMLKCRHASVSIIHTKSKWQ